MITIKKSIIIICSIVVAVICSYQITNLIIEYFSDYQISPLIQNQIPNENAMFFKWFWIYFTYFFCLLTLPFLLEILVEKLRLELSKWWIYLIVSEVIILALSHWLTPPDLLSTTFMFSCWQLVILANSLVLVKILRKQKSN